MYRLNIAAAIRSSEELLPFRSS